MACKTAYIKEILSIELTSDSACLASCVLSQEQLGSLHASTAIEIWDYLRNVLLLVLAGYYTGDEAPLGCLVAPTMCEALLVLLRKSGDPLGKFVLNFCQRH